METFTNPDGTPWTPPTREALESYGNAPVKQEYLRPLPPLPEDLVTRDGADAKDGPVDGLQQKSKRQLAREKKAKVRSGVGESLCNAFAKGICTFGEKCRFSHDASAYLKNKQPDLPGKCPFVFAKGKCPHGVMCRFYGAHEDGGEAPSEEKMLDGSSDHQDSSQSMEGVCELPLPTDGMVEELNLFSPELKMLLRKGKIRFDRSDARLKEMGVKTKWTYGAEAPTPSREKKRCEEIENDSGGDDDDIQRDSRGDDDGGGKRKKSNPDDVRGEEKDEGAEGVDIPPRLVEKKTIDFKGKLYLAPLTTVGNLPFRRVCKAFGADITCGEMALCTNLLQGQPAEWALLRRHESEDVFGAQICGGYPDSVSRCAQLIDDEFAKRGGIDFVDINMGCPIDLICNKGAGSMLLQKPDRMEAIARSASALLSCPLTLKTRMGYYDDKKVARELIPKMPSWGVCAVTLHGRSRQQRYSRTADWKYIGECVSAANALCGDASRGGASSGTRSGFSVIGNGDVYNYREYAEHCESSGGAGVATCMIARGALIKPWLFTEIKEQRDWDISSGERFEILKKFTSFGLEHWGADARGVANTRRFLLEWLSFLHRYVPVGVLERVRVGIHERPPVYCGRDHLETLMASTQARDWVEITTMLLGPVPSDFHFRPKHKSNAYASAGSEAEAATRDWAADVQG
jgi:tRNA-dihydrouridine synthase 3